MKARAMFLCSLILMFGALAMLLRGRIQLSESFQARHGGDREVFREFAHRGGWFIYPAWVLGAGGVACLPASYRRPNVSPTYTLTSASERGTWTHQKLLVSLVKLDPGLTLLTGSGASKPRGGHQTTTSRLPGTAGPNLPPSTSSGTGAAAVHRSRSQLTTV
jgi:hypothetical protein